MTHCEWLNSLPMAAFLKPSATPEKSPATQPATTPRAEKPIDPTAIDLWGAECTRGFVRDARFGPGQVIKGTNRGRSRAVRKVIGGGE